MKRVILAALVAGTFALPAYPQTAPAPTEPAPLVFEGQIPVAEEAPVGSSTMGGVAAGTAAAIIIIGVGLVIACGIACAN